MYIHEMIIQIVQVGSSLNTPIQIYKLQDCFDNNNINYEEQLWATSTYIHVYT